MAIPSKQIGWGTEENLLWQISKQLDTLTKVAGNIGKTTSTTSTTTSTTTINPNNISLTVTNSAANFDIPENSNFTVEWFAYYATTDGHPRAFSFGSYYTGGASHAVSIENGTFYWWVDGAIKISNSVTIEDGWHHMCIQRTSNITDVFIDGVSIGSIPFMNAIPTQGKPLYIGSEGDDSLSNALFSNFRWNSYTAEYNQAGFTPPTEPLGAGIGTSLLLFQGNSLQLELTDNSEFSQEINNGTGAYNGGNPFAGQEGSILFGTL